MRGSEPETGARGTAALGADNRYVLSGILGYGPERVEELARSAVVATAPPGQH